MDAPFYTVTVASLTAGWSYTTTHGDTPTGSEPVLLGDPLTYRWGFADNLIPGQLLPSVASVTLFAATADDVPEVQIGDEITLDVALAAGSGTEWSRVFMGPAAETTPDTFTKTGPAYGWDSSVSSVEG